MKLPGLSSYLGLALGERSILAAEVSVSGDRRHLRRAAEFTIPADLSWERPEQLGEALRHFLRHNKFSASRAVVGVPARWMMARDKEIPPASETIAVNALRLQAERLFPPELKELVFDFAGEADPREARRVLLVALPKQRLDQVVQMADSAGLSVQGVSSSTLTLTAATTKAGGSDFTLAVGSDAAEFAATAHGTPHVLRHMAAPVVAAAAAKTDQAGGAPPAPPANPAANLGTELRRIVSMMPMNGHSRELNLWDGVGLSDGDDDALSTRVGLTVKRGDALKALGVADAEPGVVRNPRFAPAVALAIAGVKAKGARRALPVDFLHARLAPQKVQRVGRGMVWGIILAAVTVFVVVMMYTDVQRQEKQLATLTANLRELAPTMKADEELQDRVSHARGWFEGRPKLMEGFREVVDAFPRESDQVWATNVTVQEARETDRRAAKPIVRIKWKATIAGKATDQRHVLTVLDKLKNNPKLSEVKMGQIQEAMVAAGAGTAGPLGGRDRESSGSGGADRSSGGGGFGGRSRERTPEVSFSLSFTLTSVE